MYEILRGIQVVSWLIMFGSPMEPSIYWVASFLLTLAVAPQHVNWDYRERFLTLDHISFCPTGSLRGLARPGCEL